jgi:hypothetical protein
MSRQSLKARRALRSAAARKGWETRKLNRQLAEFDRHAASGAGETVSLESYRVVAVPRDLVAQVDANPWPRVVAAVKRVVGGFVGWLR